MTAQPISCDNGDGNLAALLVTNLDNGDTLAYCGACVPTWARTLADVLDPPQPANGADISGANDPGDDGERGGESHPRPRRAKATPAPVPTGTNDLAATLADVDAAADQR